MPTNKKSTVASQEARIKQLEAQLAEKKALAANAKKIAQLERQLTAKKPAPRKK